MKQKNNTKSFGFLISLFIALLFLMPLSITAQVSPKKQSKQELETEVIKLRRIIDSLKAELEGGQIPLSDTTSLNDTINPGGLDFLDSESDTGKAPSTDSLLHKWYLNKSLNFADFEPFDLDSTNFTTDIPDSIFISRLKAINSFIPLPYNNIVKNHILFYTQKSKEKMSVMLGFANYYLPQFEEIFDEYDLPKELKVMAVIESALNPVARSRVNARGMWQFMYRTALQYNLEINSYVDERLDPIKSGHAAAKYLRDSYTIFGDWALAIASYNCGAGNVNKAIRRAGGSRDFWTIYPYLPRETRGYVPSFVAALYTLNYYKEHRIIPKPVQLPVHVDTFLVKKPLHFGQISELLGISKEEIASLNPQYINEIIPSSENGYVLKLPYNYTSAFVDVEDSIFNYKDSIFFNPIMYAKKSLQVTSREGRTITHRVRSGETLGGIAIKYGVRLSDLRSWNGVKNKISIGQRLTIYTIGGKGAGSISNSGPIKTSKSDGYLVYTIRKGDTLYEIARKFEGVSVDELLKLNNLTSNSKIMPGKKIKLKPS